MKAINQSHFESLAIMIKDQQKENGNVNKSNKKAQPLQEIRNE